MVKIPDAAIGTVVGALIAGTVSLLGLIISKEQKTSDFRQNWIDALRADLSAYLTQINAIHDAAQVSYSNLAEKVSALQPLYIPLNTSTFNILLRVNPKEQKSKDLLDAMEVFGQILANEEELNTSNIRDQESAFLSAAQALLKFEWKRVKSGEPTFKTAKFLAFLVVLVSLASGSLAAYTLWGRPFLNDVSAGLTTTETPADKISQVAGSKVSPTTSNGKN